MKFIDTPQDLKSQILEFAATVEGYAEDGGRKGKCEKEKLLASARGLRAAADFVQLHIDTLETRRVFAEAEAIMAAATPQITYLAYPQPEAA